MGLFNWKTKKPVIEAYSPSINPIIQTEDMFRTQIANTPSYGTESKRLQTHEYQVFSQSGEDGIINEIFNRIGISNRFFIEFGVGGGIENNTAHLLLQGWSGLWIETDPAAYEEIKKRFQKFIANKKLTVLNAYITRDNIESLFNQVRVPKEFDLLSIDIDGMDYWVLNAIRTFSPRVITIEYNAAMGPKLNWVIPHQAMFRWDGTSYFGASLKAYELLAAQKGYALTGCTLSGINAFFVRNDLAKDRFCQPYISENHYEPARYYLVHTKRFQWDNRILASDSLQNA